eukprot:PhM_4_TR3073/c0_g2_i1/m.102584
MGGAQHNCFPLRAVVRPVRYETRLRFVPLTRCDADRRGIRKHGCQVVARQRVSVVRTVDHVVNEHVRGVADSRGGGNRNRCVVVGDQRMHGAAALSVATPPLHTEGVGGRGCVDWNERRPTVVPKPYSRTCLDDQRQNITLCKSTAYNILSKGCLHGALHFVRGGRFALNVDNKQRTGPHEHPARCGVREREALGGADLRLRRRRHVVRVHADLDVDAVTAGPNVPRAARVTVRPAPIPTDGILEADALPADAVARAVVVTVAPSLALVSPVPQHTCVTPRAAPIPRVPVRLAHAPSKLVAPSRLYVVRRARRCDDAAVRTVLEVHGADVNNAALVVARTRASAAPAV